MRSSTCTTPTRTGSRTRFRLGPGDDLAMRHQEPAVIVGRPLTPCCGDASKLLGIRVTRLDRVRGELRLRRPLRPGAAPPLALQRGGEHPGGGTRLQVDESGLARPALHVSARVGLATVPGVDVVVEL